MLKRLLVLAVFLALFVTVFLVRFHFVDARIDRDFRNAREQYHVEGLELTTTTPPVERIAAPTPPPLQSAAVPVPSASTPGGTPDTNNPAADAPVDSNSLIGPVPPSSNAPSATPMDSTTPGNPPATNSSPDSTLIYPGLRQLPLAMMASTVSHGPRIQTTGVAPAAPAAPSPAVSAAPATTNAEVPAPAPGTNAPSPRAEPVSESREPHGPVASSVIVLGFHQFTPPGVRAGGKMIYTMPQDVFEYEMKYLKDNHYNVVPLSDVVAFAKRQMTLPPNTVAVTIDDGYKSAIVYAAPVLKKYGFPWTFFVYPSFITRTESKGAASWPDLVELQKEGVDIECHSMTHPQLPKHGSKTPEQYDAWLTNETVNSKAIIEKELSKTVKYFAYPYGAYNKQVEAKTIGAGYEAIFTVANNPIHPGTNVYAMGRYIITTPVEKAYVSYLREGALGLGDIVPAPGATVTDPRPVISAVLGYSGKINPTSIVAEVGNMGEVKYDFDPKALTLRLYLPRDLIEPTVKVNIHAKDADTGKTMVASWHFNYQATAPGVAHAPIGAPGTTNPASATPVPPAVPTATNAAHAVESNAAPATAPVPATHVTVGAPGAETGMTTNGFPASNAVPAPTQPAEQAAPAADSNAAPAGSMQ